jgi:hypothetical protein
VDTLAIPLRLPLSKIVSAGALDLDHFRAGFGEQKRRKRARKQGREVENDGPFKRQRHTHMFLRFAAAGGLDARLLEEAFASCLVRV